MSKEENPDILKAGLSRPLTGQELAQWEAWLQQHPLEASELEAELGLNRLLRELPDRPISSNFTAQALEAVRDSSRQAGWKGLGKIDWSRLKPSLRWVRPAIASGLVLISVMAWWQYEAQHRSRVELARSVANVTEVTRVVPMDVLQDFDAIHRLSQAPVEVDVALLQALE